jgi:hypothetical protein
MKTRSQARSQAHNDVNNIRHLVSKTDRCIADPNKSKTNTVIMLPYEPIDFDDASNCWRANKKSIGNGQFKYVCPYMKDDQIRCGRNVIKGHMTCRNHQ